LDESEIDDSRDRPCNELFKVGGETVCLDLARRGGGLALSQTIDNLQDFDRLARYGKILISDDASVIDDIRKRSRLGITNLDKIETMATRTDPQTGGKSLIATSRSRTQPESSVHGTSRMPSMTHDNATKMDLELAEERVDLHIKALTASVLLWKRIVVAGLALCLCFTLVLFAVMWRIQNVTIMGMPSTTEGVASKQSSDHQPEQTATGFITMGAPPNQTAGQSQPSGASIDPKPGGAPLVPSVTWRQMESSKVEKAQKDLDEIIRDLHDMVSGMNGKNREKLNHILDAATDGRNALN
jgi:hypothetical protein